MEEGTTALLILPIFPMIFSMKAAINLFLFYLIITDQKAHTSQKSDRREPIQFSQTNYKTKRQNQTNNGTQQLSSFLHVSKTPQNYKNKESAAFPLSSQNTIQKNQTQYGTLSRDNYNQKSASFLNNNGNQKTQAQYNLGLSAQKQGENKISQLNQHYDNYSNKKTQYLDSNSTQKRSQIQQQSPLTTQQYSKSPIQHSQNKQSDIHQKSEIMSTQQQSSSKRQVPSAQISPQKSSPQQHKSTATCVHNVSVMKLCPQCMNLQQIVLKKQQANAQRKADEEFLLSQRKNGNDKDVREMNFSAQRKRVQQETTLYNKEQSARKIDDKQLQLLENQGGNSLLLNENNGSRYPPKENWMKDLDRQVYEKKLASEQDKINNQANTNSNLEYFKERDQFQQDKIADAQRKKIEYRNQLERDIQHRKDIAKQNQTKELEKERENIQQGLLANQLVSFTLKMKEQEERIQRAKQEYNQQLKNMILDKQYQKQMESQLKDHAKDIVEKQTLTNQQFEQERKDQQKQKEFQYFSDLQSQIKNNQLDKNQANKYSTEFTGLHLDEKAMKELMERCANCHKEFPTRQLNFVYKYE